VKIEDGVEALIVASDLPDGGVRAGDKLKAEVQNIDAMDRRLTMTARKVGETPQAEQLEAVKREQAGSKGATLGDLLKEKLGDKLTSMTGGTESKAETDGDDA
jgi:hypothetical protein